MKTTKTLAIMNQKGGVAKTVTTLNLASILAHDHGRRVLVIDADSQGNASAFLGGNGGDRSLAKLLRIPKIERTGFSLKFAADLQIGSTPLENVDLLPADDSLMDLDLSAARSDDVYTLCLRDLLEIGGLGEYDHILIDCPPAFNAAAAAALLAADAVLIPVKLDAFSLAGMANLMRQIANMQRLNPRLAILGVLPTLWRRSDDALMAVAQLKDAGLRVFEPIRYSPTVDRMTFLQRPLIEMSPRSGALHDYRTFAKALLKGGDPRGV